MKILSNDKLTNLFGGSDPNCDYLQFKADLHKKLETQKAEDEWWDEWAEDWIDCVSKL